MSCPGPRRIDKIIAWWPDATRQTAIACDDPQRQSLFNSHQQSWWSNLDSTLRNATHCVNIRSIPQPQKTIRAEYISMPKSSIANIMGGLIVIQYAQSESS
jgi:hypothetical protein